MYDFFLDEECPVRGFASVAPVSLHVQYNWTIPSGAWTHRRTLFKRESEELVRVFHSELLRQKALEKAGHCSPKWTVLRSLQ
jgi:hypothetical protein